MRIGEILLQDGSITATQLDSALGTQHQRGLRLGSTLVELGWIDADVLARALGKQLGVPPALRKHFAQIDASVVARLPRKLSEKHEAIPLGFSTKHARTLIVAFIDPHRQKAIEEIGFAVGARIQASVAPEHVVRAMLARHYGVGSSPRAHVALDPGAARSSSSNPPLLGNTPPVAIPKPSNPGFPATQPSSPRLVASKQSRPRIHLSLPPPAEVVEASPPPPSLGDPLPTSAPPVSGTHPNDDAEPAGELHVGVDLGQTIERLARATTRNEIGDALTDYLLSAFDLGLVLIAKDQVALGWKGFASSIDASIVESISLPLTAQSALRIAHDDKRPFVGPPPTEGAAVQQRLWKLLRTQPPTEVIVAPVLVGDRVVNLVYAHPLEGESIDEAKVAEVEALCNAASVAYVRLLRDRSARG